MFADSILDVESNPAHTFSGSGLPADDLPGLDDWLAKQDAITAAELDALEAQEQADRRESLYLRYLRVG